MNAIVHPATGVDLSGRHASGEYKYNRAYPPSTESPEPAAAYLRNRRFPVHYLAVGGRELGPSWLIPHATGSLDFPAPDAVMPKINAPGRTCGGGDEPY